MDRTPEEELLFAIFGEHPQEPEDEDASDLGMIFGGRL